MATCSEDEVMSKLALPYEVKASFEVPREQAEKLVSKFKTGISFPGLLPDGLKSSDAGIDTNAGEGSHAKIWVVFKPRHGSNRVVQRSLESRRPAASEPVPQSAYNDFISPKRDG
jgi:hypothetical protein